MTSGVLVVAGGGVERRTAILVLRIHIRPGVDEGRENFGVLVVPGGAFGAACYPTRSSHSPPPRP